VTYSILTTSYEHESCISIYIYIYHRVRFKSNGVGCNFVMNGKIKIYGKQNTDSVSQCYETESVFRFKKNSNFFYETDYRIRFKMLWNGICIPFPIHFDFFCETTFVFRLVKVWNAFENPFHKRFRYIVYETENKFRFTSQANRKNLSWYEG